MDPSEPPRWDLLSELVHARRASLGLTMKAVAEAGGPSDSLLGRIESGHWAPTRGVTTTLTKLDAGLLWEPGSAAGILTGHPPRELIPPPPTSTAASPTLIAIENELDAIRFIARTLDTLPAESLDRVLTWMHSRYGQPSAAPSSVQPNT